MNLNRYGITIWIYSFCKLIHKIFIIYTANIMRITIGGVICYKINSLTLSLKRYPRHRHKHPQNHHHYFILLCSLLLLYLTFDL